jgi:hypothetical protein
MGPRGRSQFLLNVPVVTTTSGFFDKTINVNYFHLWAPTRCPRGFRT